MKKLAMAFASAVVLLSGCTSVDLNSGKRKTDPTILYEKTETYSTSDGTTIEVQVTLREKERLEETIVTRQLSFLLGFPSPLPVTIGYADIASMYTQEEITKQLKGNHDISKINLAYYLGDFFDFLNAPEYEVQDHEYRYEPEENAFLVVLLMEYENPSLATLTLEMTHFDKQGAEVKSEKLQTEIYYGAEKRKVRLVKYDSEDECDADFESRIWVGEEK